MNPEHIKLAEFSRDVYSEGLRYSFHFRDNYRVMALPGSRDFEDWWSNFQASLVPWEFGGEVHSGFWAVAILLASYCKRKHPEKSIFAVTFGAPPVGDQEFCDTFPVVCHRYVNGIDPVPRLPGVHCGVEVPIGQHGMAVSTAIGINPILRRALQLHDHRIANYIESLYSAVAPG